MNAQTRIKLLFTLIALVFCVPLAGSQNPNTSRGFTPDGVFQFNDVDHVNLFNGGLVVSVPVGQTYTAGDRLQYSLGLTYNSSIWDTIPHASVEGDLSESVPNRNSNAGVGWLLTLGELVIGNEIEYIAPDGAQHSFKASTLHFGDDVRDGDSVLYTRDGSYLRLRKVISGTQHYRIVDFPNGTSQEFLCVNACDQLTNSVTQFHLQRISDPFGNEVTIERDPEPQGNSLPLSTTWTWTIREKSEGGRETEHYIHYQYNANAPYRWVVKEVEMEVSPSSFTPDQTITERRRASYKFHYGTTEETTTLFRHTNHIAPVGLTIVQPQNTKRMVVPMLQSLELPDGTSWRFGYHRSQDDDADVVKPFPGRAYWTANFDGLLNRYWYPTGGGVRYEYGTYSYPRRTCIPGGGGGAASRPRSALSTGIRRRWLVKPDGNDEGQPWRYISTTNRAIDTQDGTWPYDCDPAHTFRTTLVDPQANATVNYFSIYVTGDNNTIGAQRTEYGLPFTRAIPDPTDATRFISTKVFQCSTTDFFDPDHTQKSEIYNNAADPSRVCTPKRETYVRYESSGIDCPPFDDDNGPGCISANRRMAEQRIVYKDDGDTWTLTRNSDFDGLGHYRETHVSGNFYDQNFPNSTVIRPHADHKASRQEWNTGVSFNGGAQTFTGFPSVSERWLLNRYTEIANWEVRDTTDAKDSAAKGGTARVQYRFDDRGFMTHMRTLKGDAPGGTDVLVTYERFDAEAGRIRIEERYYGGDGENIGTGALGTFTPSGADYAIDLTYRFGALERKEYKTCNGAATILLVERNEIDPATGLLLSTRDAAGAITSYLYDRMNRLVELRPPGEAKTVYAYNNAVVNGAQFTPATVTSTRQDNTSKKPQSKWEFDGWGRLITTLKHIPDDGGDTDRWSRQEIRYYTNGWKKEETTFGLQGVNNPGVMYLNNYDPFGRVGEIIHADNDPAARTHKTNFTYKGARAVTKVITGVAVGSDLNGTATTIQLFDPHGRLMALTEGTNLQTVYEYDTSDRLYKVTQGTQVRSYDYDNRGFLQRQKDPEVGSNGIGFGDYDARGNVHEKYFAGTGTNNRHEYDLSFIYDGAERLTLVKQPGKGGRPLKSFGYFQNTSAGAHLLGKLRQTKRHNYVYDTSGTLAPREVIVTEVYDYYASNHRLKTKRVAAPGVRFTTTFDYDNLGNVDSIVYPRLSINCVPSATCGTVGPDLTVPSTYTYGYLASVPGFIQSISYHGNEMPYKVKHANNVTWIQDVPLRNLKRPTQIRIENASSNWSTGSYRYDATGSIFKIDNDTFTYDTMGRLVTAAMSGGTQSFEYDRHGNITKFAGQDLLPDAATNRLPATIATYDTPGGNMLTYKDPRQQGYNYVFEYDPFGLVRHMTGWSGQTQVLGRMYLYNADEERVAVIDYVGAKPNVRETWSARDHGQRVIRDFDRLYDPGVKPAGGANPAARGWTWTRDYVFRDTTLAATIDGTGTSHVHVDHLGTTRVTTNATRTTSTLRIFRPFGEELVSTPDTIRLKFTGHERDDAGGDLIYGDLDYMHARYYSMHLGRFLSVDPDGYDTERPQTFNRYSYVTNNPVTLNDPTGRCLWDVCVGEGIAVAAAATAVTAWAVAPSPVDPSKSNMEVAGQQLRDGAIALLNLVKEMRSPDGKPGETAKDDSERGKFKEPVRDKLWEDADGKCVICGVPTARPGEKPVPGETLPSNTDHIKPHADGGSNREPNGQNTCETCNKSGGRRAEPKTTGMDKLNKVRKDQGKPPLPPKK
jgi:RHS repeat-associated protein